MRLTLAEQASIADVIVEGTVVRLDTEFVAEDGFPITLLRLEVNTLLRGNVPSGRLSLGLPGGYDANGRYEEVIGLPEVVRVGDSLVVFGDAVSDSEVQLLSGPQSMLRKSTTPVGDIVTDYDGNPVIDLGCTGSHLIARPANQAPVNEATGLGEVSSATRVFVNQPELLGLPWSSFLDTVSDCIDEQPAAPGNQIELGGGW